MTTTTQLTWQTQASVAYTTVIWLSHCGDATAVALRECHSRATTTPKPNAATAGKTEAKSVPASDNHGQLTPEMLLQCPGKTHRLADLQESSPGWIKWTPGRILPQQAAGRYYLPTHESLPMRIPPRQAALRAGLGPAAGIHRMTIGCCFTCGTGINCSTTLTNNRRLACLNYELRLAAHPPWQTFHDWPVLSESRFFAVFFSNLEADWPVQSTN
ncbi:hypothetical protein PGT21_024985 [Puccinia graminis f. sp. tritici]|uniref:Uncharacterized protein n=1 Tax=Puccinia graminis f. sp. tritici TaxID=56615 RepID=A0A5B0Q6G6_PUCGR|nr:hypothetical protein PGT21_024985 [Puccinia graminis f. sp. tritici]